MRSEVHFSKRSASDFLVISRDNVDWVEVTTYENRFVTVALVFIASSETALHENSASRFQLEINRQKFGTSTRSKSYRECSFRNV